MRNTKNINIRYDLGAPVLMPLSLCTCPSVLEGLKKQDPHRNSIVKNLWKEAEGDFRGVTKKVYEANLVWIV